MTYIKTKVEPPFSLTGMEAQVIPAFLAMLILSASCIITVSGGQTVQAGREYIVCAFYGDKAQEVFDTNPEKYSKLDRDDDGRACE